jgi:hypothetical protein
MKSADACLEWAKNTGLTDFRRCSEDSHTKDNCALACKGEVIVEADKNAIKNLVCEAQKKDE